MLDPAATGLGLPLFVTVRSHSSKTGVFVIVLAVGEFVAVTEEFAVIGVAVTLAGTFTTITIFAVAPTAKLGLVQLIFPVNPTAGVVQTHPAGAITD
jgi:hypothetical protein